MNQFYKDVIEGLSASPKHLKSKYFYDKKGDELFQQIMDCREYYLTDCEMEIFSRQTNGIAQTFLKHYQEFDVIELGAGDAVKSTHLLQQLSYLGKNFTYYPIDISQNVIRLLETEMPLRVPNIKIHGLNGEYFDMLQKANGLSKKNKVVLFLGSNIGNFTVAEAERFLSTVKSCLLPGDLMLIGFDLKKNPKVILDAYNDAAGITKAFNLNLLTRINRELGADFDVTGFDHYPVYDPITGSCKSYLISLKAQKVCIADTEVIVFEENEPIHMELSQKYSIEQTDALAHATGFKPIAHFLDSKNWFLDSVWECI